VNMVKRSKLLS